MKVSVITPVYNAAEFVARAVESALAQPETAEVLLIEDGSPDNSLEVCQALAEKYDKVRLLRHPNGENRGAGASRNLGLKYAKYEYIGFVDADNYFLPDRFTTSKLIFSTVIDCEGVYESIGMDVKDEYSLNRWKKSNKPDAELKGLSKAVEPDLLAIVLITGGYGGLTLDGLVFKREVLKKSGYMAEELRLHQDSEFIRRLALVANLYPGRLEEPVAMRGVHDHNRISAPRSEAKKYKDRMLMWMVFYSWCKQNATIEIRKLVLNRMILLVIGTKRIKNGPLNFLPSGIARLVYLALWFIRHPKLIFDVYAYQSIKQLLIKKS